MHPCSTAGQRAVALSVTTVGGRRWSGRGGVGWGGVLPRSEMQTLIAPHDARCPAHSLRARNNEAVIPPVAVAASKKKKRPRGEYR